MDDITKLTLKERLGHLVDAMKEYNAAVETHQSEIKKIESMRGTWDPNYIEAKKKNIFGLGPIKAKQLEKIGKLADEFTDYYEQYINRPIDLNDDRLGNALSLIKSGALDYEAAKKLNENFIGDQPTLKILKNAYEKTSTPTGGIDKMIMPYGPEDLRHGIRQSAYEVIHQGALPNHYGKAVKTVSDYLGLDVDATIQANALTQQLRAGAGLPQKD